MEKEDVKVLIHAGLALIVIFGGFALIELYGKPIITGGAVGARESKDIYCVQVNKIQHKGVDNKDSCCRMIQKADMCQLLDGSMEIGFDYAKRTGEPAGLCKAEYLCSSSTGAEENRLYFGFDTYEYCELSGYRVILS